MKPNLLRPLFVLLVLLGLVLSACMPAVSPTQDTYAIHTAAARTVAAQLTLNAGQTAVVQLTQMAGPYPVPATPDGSSGGMPTATIPPFQLPTNTPWATLTPWPTYTAPPVFVPTRTAIPPLPTAWSPPPTAWSPPPPTWAPPPPPASACDWAQFVRDVSVPDGTVVAPGSSFAKTWRLRNIGDCTWTRNYSVAYVGGDRMTARTSYGLNGSTRPGETLDLSIEFIAPGAPGRYRASFMLADASGRRFGIGSDAKTPFWIDITVRAGAVDPVSGYDFVANVCDAQWHNGVRSLPCPGNPSSSDGSVVVLGDPRLETGKHENEPALWTRPSAKGDAMISGKYPALKLQAGDRFMADIGCLEGSRTCDVTFVLDYQISGQAVRNLGSWRQVYDGALERIVVDLSPLAGEKVSFILRVVNNGAIRHANAFWLVPQIRRAEFDLPPVNSDHPAVLAAIRRLSNDLGVPLSAITLVQVQARQWTDSCMGITTGVRQACAQMMVDGFQVTVDVDGLVYDIHVSLDGVMIVWKKR